jgi:hypothetical protein
MTGGHPSQPRYHHRNFVTEADSRRSMMLARFEATHAAAAAKGKQAGTAPLGVRYWKGAARGRGCERRLTPTMQCSA